MSKLLNKRHEKLAKEIIKTRSPSKAYFNLNDCTKGSASSASSKLIKNNPHIMLRVDELLDQYGLDDVNLAKKIKKMTSAKKEVLDTSGNIRQLKDNTTQLAAVNMALKLKGHLQGTPLIDNRVVNIDGNSQGSNANTEQLDKAVESMKIINEGFKLSQTFNDGELSTGYPQANGEDDDIIDV